MNQMLKKGTLGILKFTRSKVMVTDSRSGLPSRTFSLTVSLLEALEQFWLIDLVDFVTDSSRSQCESAQVSWVRINHLALRCSLFVHSFMCSFTFNHLLA